MASQGEDAYCTLVMSDSYLPGAAVLAHSLRDSGSKKKLACLITLDTLSADSISELKELYDYVIPVPRVGNPKPANLYLMDRGDLAYTFTKIALWRQLQFRKLVYIDADVVALRAPDELFDIDAPFAAAPDSGWPDCFNSGVMVVSPNMGDYWALQTLASSGDSFDGADQGLLNQYYEHKDWHRLSFLYNCTPNAQYQWEPAFKHYKSRISLVHFIGKSKPWSRDARYGGKQGVYSELSARWWAVYDRHLRAKAEQVDANEVLQAAPNTIRPGEEHAQAGPNTGEARPATETPFTQPSEPTENIVQQSEARPEPERKFSPPHMEWDATRSAPPVHARPEAANFPTETYTFSDDKHLFKAPTAYPEPPKNMWYEVPESKPAPRELPKPIFPWEQERERPKPTRVFAEDLASPEPEPQPISAPAEEAQGTSSAEDGAQTDLASPPSATPRTPDDPWQSFSQTSANAWDAVPGIERYVRAVMGAQTKKSKPSGLTLEGLARPAELFSPTGEGTSGRRESLILTDFPSAVERPSLPVTPAPLRRPTFWGGERDETGELPTAEGVPPQTEWVSGQFEWACPKCGFRSSSVESFRRSPSSHRLPSSRSFAASQLLATTIAALSGPPLATSVPELPVHLAPVTAAKPFKDDERDDNGEEDGAEVAVVSSKHELSAHRPTNPEERLETLRRSSLLELEHLRQTTASNAPLRAVPEHSVPRPHHDAQHHSLPGSGTASPRGSHTSPKVKEAISGSKVPAADETKPAFSVPDFSEPSAVQEAESAGKDKEVKEDVLSPSEQS